MPGRTPFSPSAPQVRGAQAADVLRRQCLGSFLPALSPKFAFRRCKGESGWRPAGRERSFDDYRVRWPPVPLAAKAPITVDVRGITKARKACMSSQGVGAKLPRAPSGPKIGISSRNEGAGVLELNHSPHSSCAPIAIHMKANGRIWAFPTEQIRDLRRKRKAGDQSSFPRKRGRRAWSLSTVDGRVASVPAKAGCAIKA